jgi:hypothetical protein
MTDATTTPIDPAAPETWPVILHKSDLAKAARKSERTIERLRRARRLPEPLDIPGRPCWAREDILAWLRTGATAQRRRA